MHGASCSYRNEQADPSPPKFHFCPSQGHIVILTPRHLPFSIPVSCFLPPKQKPPEFSPSKISIVDPGIRDTATTTTESRDFRPVDCDEGECINPETSECEIEVRCFADPCDVGTDRCRPGEVCVANYCGGCHVQCLPGDDGVGGVVGAVKMDS
ncbi:hypothetical protein ACHAXS_008418 [Conticribra weissflogii]